jgi:tetratricopeptide (TPR) repeat protein
MSKKKAKATSNSTTENHNKEISDGIRLRPHPRIIENFLVVWLDSNLDDLSIDDSHDIVDQLRSIVNSVNTFNDVDRCVDFLSDIKDEKVFMIISGSLGQQIISHIHDISQLHSIYVFCGSKIKHEQWVKDWPKIKGVFTQIGPICDSLKQTAQKCEQNFIPVSFVTASEVSDQILDQLDQSFMYTQILKEIIFEIKYNEQSIKDLVTYCREQYAGNQNELQIIDRFEKEYHKNSPIWWYTYECFIHLMLNRALRTHEVDIIIKMGFFIQDLHRQIDELHKEQSNDQQKRSFTVYRGQGMLKGDFEKMIKAKGGLMSFNNFLSTSKKRKISFEYSQDALNNIDMIGILFKMIIEPSNLSTPFALIDGISYYSSEQEVLFSMHTVFRIGEIKQIDNNNRLYQVELKLTSIKNQQIIALTERMREETRGSTGWHRLGMLLIKLGKFDKAEQVYKALFDLTTDENEKALLHHQLGLIKRNQGDYQEALISYQKALEVYQKTLPEDHPDLATSYNNIGQVYNSIGEYSKALSYYQNSLEIYQKTLDSNHPSLAISYNNIGWVHKFMGDYPKALESHEKALEIEQKTLPPSHPSLATSYNNIGLVYKNMGEYSKALDFHEKALEIEQKTLPSNHPSLAISYNNIGLLYDNIGEYSKALSFYEKTLEIYQKILPSNHPDLATSYNNIGSVYKNMGEYAKALLFYEKTLEIEEKVLPPNHPDLAISYSNIGTIYDNMGEYSKALESHEKALEIRQKTLPSRHRMLATYYNNKGSVYDTMGNYTEALVYYEKTLDIERETLPPNHPDLATSYNNIGLVYINKGEYNTALFYHTKALEIYEKALPPNHPNLANSYNNIALVYEKMNEYSKALSYYKKALEIRQKTLPSNHPDLAISFSNLWQLYQTMGDNVKAYLTYQQSIEIRPSDHLDVIHSYNVIEQVYGNKQESSKTSSFVRPVIKNVRISQVPKHMLIKNFRMKLELRTKKK